jgi:muramoyltetrapeptide carboxypeptidase
VRPGATVAIVAPAGTFDRESFEAGLAILAQRYQPRFEPSLFSQHRYLAGDDERRLQELLVALTDPDVDALFCARGGYGSMRLLRRLWTALPAGSPLKPLIGFSDITALHQLWQRRDCCSIHGPVMTQLGRQSEALQQRLFSLLESDRPAEAPLVGTTTFVPGVVEGPLLGGNLSMVTRLLGTPFMPRLESAILLLEDVGERPYRLDRMWTHLELAGVFERVVGIALGSFEHCEERGADYSSADVLQELALRTGLPCAAGFPIGHGAINEPVPLGVRVRLDASECQLTLLEAAVSK